MGTRAEALAKRFEQLNQDVIDAVEGCSDAQWRAACQGEGWPVGVTAYHIASSHKGIAGVVQAVGTGQPLPPITMDDINAGNAKMAKEHANCTKQEVLEMLRRDGEAAAKTLRGMSDEQLDRKAQLFSGPEMSAEQVAERILIGHPQGHLESIRQAQA